MRVKDGKLIDKLSGRPVQWPAERLLKLLEAVQSEKKKTGLSRDLDVLKRLAEQKEWESPPNSPNKIELGANTTRGFVHFKVAYMTRSTVNA